jgi:hypothetical protein
MWLENVIRIKSVKYGYLVSLQLSASQDGFMSHEILYFDQIELVAM